MVIDNKTKLYSTEDAAVRLGISVHSVRKFLERGTLKSSHSVGRVHLLSEEDCVRYEKNKKPRGNPAFIKRSAKKKK